MSGRNAQAQFDTASVLGYVHDNSGAAVPNATVTLTNVATGIAQTKQTDNEGKYEFPSVQIGNYQISTEATGFDRTRTETFAAQTNARQRVDVTLKTGSVSEEVTVTSAAQMLETETSSHSTVIGTREVENLPLNGRSYADLTLLAPGVRKSALETQTTSSREGSFNVNGIRSAFNNFLLDGLDNNNYGTSNQGFANENIPPSPDAISEFRVETNNYSAEYGRNVGAVINATVRRGTNKFHGRAWDYDRNTMFNAIGPFLATGATKPKFIRNQFGGTFGGPIWKDHTFFFADYEGVRQIFNNPSASSVIPTNNQRNGLFYLNDDASNPANAIPLQDPITGRTFTGSIPNAQWTLLARNVITALPTPTASGLSNNYTITPRGIINDDKGDARVDHNFSQNLSVFGRYSQHAGYIFDPPSIPGPAGGNSNGNTSITNKAIAGGVTWAISANKLLDARFGWSENKGGKTPVGAGQPSLLVASGITDGLPTDPNVVRPLNAQSVTGFSQFGALSSNPQFQNPTIFNPKVNFTWLKGKHSLKFGYEYQAVNTQVNDFNPSYGADNYAGQYSNNGLPAAIANLSTTQQAAYTSQLQQARNLADFYFGNRSSYSLTTYAVVNLRQRYNFMYVQDDFKVSPKLTINAGLRYEIVTPQWERDNKLSNFDPVTKTLIAAKDGSTYNRALVNTPMNNFAPRFGFAYQAAQNTVLRGGYGIGYTQWNRAGGENNLTYNGPNVVNASITQVAPTASSLCTNDTQLQSTCFRQTQQGYSNILTAPSNFNPANVTSRYIPKNFKTGYLQSYFIGIQQQLGHGWLVDASYVGNKGTHFQILADYNQGAPCVATSTTTCGSLASRRPVQGFGDIEIAYGGGSTNYNSMQLKVEKRTSVGLYLLNSFTYSRAFDLSGGHLETANGDNSRVDFNNPSASYGPSGYDQPLADTLSVVYDLPYGHGRRWGNSAGRLVEAALGDWQMTLINSMTSGAPININYSLSSASGIYGTDLVTYRPNRVAGVPIYGTTRTKTATTVSGVFNNAAFALPTSYPFGSATRNLARANAFYQADFGLHKAFALWNESSKFDFRAEAFNVLNKTNYNAPNSTFGGSSFGQITTAFPARQLQLAAKIIF
ncbi:MAG: TonB-dependent receptor [Edaphobacter sp.]|uniref:TonB-dependent receptor n=1 Tax=Edaphobacter sp. TaxID=1934404 RepID=UPI0023A6127E|nr:TonB-dependent receptor [Edaphobacter sp.]MDE1175764.1 TonB-dependent receptor [Edaphobacter sp.]